MKSGLGSTLQRAPAPPTLQDSTRKCHLLTQGCSTESCPSCSALPQGRQTCKPLLWLFHQVPRNRVHRRNHPHILQKSHCCSGRGRQPSSYCHMTFSNLISPILSIIGKCTVLGKGKFLKTKCHKPEKYHLSPARSGAHQWAQSHPHDPPGAPSAGKTVLEVPAHSVGNNYEEPALSQAESRARGACGPPAAPGTGDCVGAASSQRGDVLAARTVVGTGPGSPLLDLLSAIWKGLGRPASRSLG